MIIYIYSAVAGGGSEMSSSDIIDMENGGQAATTTQQQPSADLSKRRQGEGCCGVRSQWWTRSYIIDYVLCILILVGTVLFFTVYPIHQAQLVTTYNAYPHMVNQQVETWLLFILSIGIPVLAITVWVIVYSKKRKGRKLVLHELHHFLLSFFIMLALVLIITQSLKGSVGRWRPDGAAWPAGENDAHQSYPSGHASISMGCMFFLSLWIAGKFQVHMPNNDHVWKFICSYWPMVIGLYISSSRIVDYRHWPSDVNAGMGIGLVCAFLSFRLYYTPRGHPKSRVMTPAAHYMEEQWHVTHLPISE